MIFNSYVSIYNNKNLLLWDIRQICGAIMPILFLVRNFYIFIIINLYKTVNFSIGKIKMAKLFIFGQFKLFAWRNRLGILFLIQYAYKMGFMIFYLGLLSYNSGKKRIQDRNIRFPRTSGFINFENGIRMGECINQNMEQGRSYLNTNIDVSNCFFTRTLLYTNEGGIISILGGSYCMNIYHSMFYRCYSAANGGAIFFNSSQSSLKLICAHNCSSSMWGHFAYLSGHIVNNVEYLSISSCAIGYIGECPIYIVNGPQKVDNTNSSMNFAVHNSGIAIRSPSSFSSSHCTFSNNKVTGWICIGFYTNTGIMSFMNIVHNNSPTGCGVVSPYSGSLTMYYCIFNMNQDSLFYMNTGSLVVYHSFISHVGFTTVLNNNNTITNKGTYGLKFFNSFYCIADIPIKTITYTQIRVISLRSEIRLIFYCLWLTFGVLN